MTTFNRTYRSPKFFLCVHHATGDYIGFEPSHERFSQFTFLSYGEGKFYAFDGEGVEEFKSNVPKTLFDVRKHLNYDVVGQSKANTKVISFNPWRKEEEWNGRLITGGMIQSEWEYSCIVCFEGTCTINGKQIDEMQYANLKKDKEYPVEIPEGCYVGLFELCQ